MKLLIALLVFAGVVTIGACTTPALPKPDPDQAWIEVSAPPGVQLSAMRHNNQILRDGRYFQVQPQQLQRLLVRVTYDKGGSTLDSQRRCEALISYADFVAGERYKIRARANGWFVTVWLENAQGQRLKNADSVECGK